MIQSYPVSVDSEALLGASATGEVQLRSLTQWDRAGRALKLLGVCWGIALGAVFIPVLHFVLVPLIFAAGPLVAYLGYRPRRLIQGGTVRCPKCSTRLAIDRGTEAWPLAWSCTECRLPLKIRLAGGPPT